MQKPASILFLCFAIICNSRQLDAQADTPRTAARTPIPDSLRIAFLTDIHVTPGTPSEANLENIVAEINNDHHFDFTVVTGDVSNSGLDTELITVHRILGKLTAPLHIVPGNHETNWSESVCQTFPRLFGNDRFCFAAGKYLFIGFDTGPFMKMGDGHVKREDIRWLKETLAREARPGQVVISLSHYPLGDGLDNWYEVTDILKQHNTRLVLCGHGHRLSLHNFDGLPGLMGRAALINGSTTPGYNILEIRHDSVYLFEKKINEPTAAPFVAFALDDPSPVVAGRPSFPRPDTSINTSYQGHPGFSVHDSASIFTGILASSHQIVYGNSIGQLVAVDPSTKKTRWHKQYNGSIYSTPVQSNGIIAFSTIDGGIHGLDAKTGKERWTVRTGEPGISEGLAKGSDLFIGTGRHFFKLDISTGRMIWKNSDPENQLQAKPIMSPDGTSILFGVWDRHLYCLDAATGKLRWKWDNGKTNRLYSPGNVVPAIAGNKVFLVAPDRYMTAIDLPTGRTLWRNNSRHVRESMTISTDGRQVYAKTMNDTIIAVSTQTDSFHLDWESNARFGYEHNPCPLFESKGIVYAGTKNGVFIALDAATGNVLLEHKPGNSSINFISSDPHDNIWISLIEGKIQQYQPPPKNTLN